MRANGDEIEEEKIAVEDLENKEGGVKNSFFIGDPQDIIEEHQEFQIDQRNMDDSVALYRQLAFQYTQVGQLQREQFFDELNIEVQKAASYLVEIGTSLDERVEGLVQDRE